MDLFSTREILTVTELTRQLQDILEATFDQLWVEGEISNLRRPASGHLYFTLKDKDGQIRAVLFRPVARGLKFDLEDGMHIVCRARMGRCEWFTGRRAMLRRRWRRPGSRFRRRATT